MKVLHVIPSLSPVHGGPSFALPLMEEALTKAGVEVETATTNDDGRGKRNDRALGVPLRENGVIRWYFDKTFEFYKVSRGFERWMAENIYKYDLVHVHALFSHTSAVAARAAQRSGIPYIIRPLGVLSRYGMTQRRAILKRASLWLLEGKLLQGAAAVHFTSSAELDEARALRVPLRPVVIPIGGRMPEYREGWRQPYVLFLSRLDPKKNVEALLKAWAIVANRFPGWRLVIAGGGAPGYETALKREAERLGTVVKWLGRVEGQEKERWLQEAGIYVLPSFSENFGIAAVEALGFGAPCLLTQGVAVAQEVAAVDGCLVVQPEPESLASGLATLLEDGALRERLGKKGQQFAKTEYGMEAMGQRLVEMYRRILA